MNAAVRWPSVTMMRGLWHANRRGLMAMGGAVLVWALGFRLVGAAQWEGGTQDATSYLPMGLSIALAFMLCNFTESDRRGRFTGFPSRLFTLPVATRTLVSTPILFGVAVVTMVYLAWAGLVFTALGRDLPLAWPILYLATGMICFQAIVWSLARFRLVRLLALGLAGATFAVGWLAFGNEPNLPAHSTLCTVLSAMAVVAFAMAWISVEGQRRGRNGEWQGWWRLREWIADALPRRQRRFGSRSRAQFWFEWRRHGVLMPGIAAAVMSLILAPAPFVAPVRAESTALTFMCILLTPFLLAFALGKGFGKADLWSREPGLPLFLATKPMSNSEWIGAKMKAAAMAVMVAWGVVIAMTSVWLWCWCDRAVLAGWWRAAQTIYPGGGIYVASALALGVAMLLTWRLLVGSLYVGLCGKAWLIGVSACAVVLLFLASPAIGAGLTTHPMVVVDFLRSPWLPWMLAGMFGVKVVGACMLADRVRRNGWLTSRGAGRYFVLWFLATAFLVFAVQWLVPADGWWRWVGIWFALLAVPLLRPALAANALARNRWR